MIQTMQPWELIAVAMNMREEDAIEFDLLTDGVDRQKWACRRSLEPGLAFSVTDRDGRPVACFGFIDEAEGRCTAWMIATKSWACYAKSMIKTFRVVAREGNYRRIQAFARPGCPGAEKVLRWLGFTLDGPLPKMCSDGSPMNLYSYT